MNTSATGGYLASTTPPETDEELEDFFHDWLVGTTGIPEDLVRPRWQEEPPNIPDETENWVAFGIVDRSNETFAHSQQLTNGTQVSRNQELSLLASFYGPNAGGMAESFQAAAQVAQNREPLQLAGMQLVATGNLTSAPEQVKNKWYRRVDVSFSVRRRITKSFAVLPLLHSNTSIEVGNFTITTAV